MGSHYEKGGKEVELASNLLNSRPDLNVVYDIGANKGEWTLGIKQSVNRNLDFYLFDPLEYLAKKRSSSCSFATNFVVVLSDKNKKVEWFDRGPSGKGYGASYYKETTPQYKNVKPIIKQARTLDSIVEEYLLPTPDLLKIDTQGSELDILKGAVNLLEKGVKFVQLEVVKPGKRLQYNAPKYGRIYILYGKNGYKMYSDNEKAKEEKPDFDIIFERVRK